MKKEFHSFKKKKKWIAFLEWKLSVVFARFWFVLRPYLCLCCYLLNIYDFVYPQKLYPLNPVITVFIQPHQLLQMELRKQERGEIWKLDLIAIDSDSQCFTDTIKITNKVFSMNK